jgi:hypothetical protein
MASRPNRDSNPGGWLCGPLPDRSGIRPCVRPRLESNQRPRRSERRALSAELRGHGEGDVGAGGVEPPQQGTCFTGRPDSPTSARSLGVAARTRTGTTRVTTWHALPVHHSHHGSCVPAAGLEPAPDRLIRTVPSPVGRRGRGSDAGTRTPITWLTAKGPAVGRRRNDVNGRAYGTRTRSSAVKAQGPTHNRTRAAARPEVR